MRWRHALRFAPWAIAFLRAGSPERLSAIAPILYRVHASRWIGDRGHERVAEVVAGETTDLKLQLDDHLPARLRGTVLDPFGHTAERRMERTLIDDYEALHAAIESFCPDTSGEGPAAPAELKDFYVNDRRCFFWWD